MKNDKTLSAASAANDEAMPDDAVIEPTLAWAHIDALLDLLPGEEGFLNSEEVIALVVDHQAEREGAIPSEPCAEALELFDWWADMDEDWKAMWREEVARRHLSTRTDARRQALEAPISDEESVSTEEPAQKVNDANLIGTPCPEFEELMAREATFLTGKVWPDKPHKSTQAGHWKPITLTVGDHIKGSPAAAGAPAYGLSRHPVGEIKDGACVVFGSSVGGQRKARAMDTMYAIGLDIDSGASYDFVRDKVLKMGVAATMYTSWNHQKRGLDLKRDDVLKKLGLTNKDLPGGELSIQQVQTYLREHSKNRFEEDFLQQITIAEQAEQTAEGIKIILDTPPIEKFRVVFFLDKPVSFSELAQTEGTQDAALTFWENKVTGLAQKYLGVHFDTSCTDPSRLFFTARHAKGKDNWRCDIIQGKPLKFEDVQPMRKSLYTRNRDPNPFVEADDQHGEKVPQVILPSGDSLNKWHSKIGKERFLIADMLEAECPDKIRPGGGKVGMVITECPFEHEHSKEGGTGTHATNCIDSQSGYWTWMCKHDSCQGRHKLEFLGEAIREGWFSEDVLQQDDYLLPDEDENEGDEVLEELLTQARTFDTTTRDRQIETLLEEAFKQRDVIGDTGRRDILAALNKSTKLGARPLEAKWKSVAEAYAAKVVAEDARQRNGREMPDLVSLEEATPDSVFKAAAASKWLPTGFTVKEGWFCQMTEDKAKKVCREFEVLYSADGKKGSTRTNEVTIRYQHRSAALGIVDSTFRKGDCYKDSGTILARLSNEGLEFAPSAPTEAILTLLRAVSSDREAIYVERSGWLDGREVFVSPTGAVVKKDDDARVYVLDHTMKVANARAGALDDAIKAAGNALKGQNANRFLPGFLGGAVGCLADFLDEELAVIVANEGEAKRGKTTALKAGISWFAAPLADGLLITGDMTPTAMEGKAVQASGAMFAPDEQGTSKMTAQDEQAAILQYAGKIGRARGKQDGSLRDIATWHGCMGMSTERGLLARLEAEQAKDSEVTIRSGAVSRVFTVSYDDAVKLDREHDKDELAAYDVLAHGGAYGWLGPEFAKALIGWGVDAVRARVSALEKEWGAGHSGAAERVVTTAALFGIAAQVAQGAGLLPSDVDLKAMLSELLDETLAHRSHHLDTERQALDTLRRGIIRMLNQQRIVAVGNEDGIRADVVGYWSTAGKAPSDLKERTYILPVDRLGSLSNTEPAALVEKLRREGGVVEPSQKTKYHKKGFWEGTPGEGSKIRSLRVSGEWVHGDDEDPDD